jgi:signal transduction histidine kinase
MKRIRPSLVRRLLLAFTLGPLAVLAMLMIPLRPVLLDFAESNAGPQVVITLLAADVREDARGRLRLPPDAHALAIAKRAPSLWFVIRSRSDELVFGRPPSVMSSLARMVPLNIKEAHFGDVTAPSRTDDTSIASIDSPVGPLTIAVGGVEPAAITLSDWLLFAHHDSEFYIGIFLISLICMAGGPLSIPVVLAAIRPTTRAAARLDPADLSVRLSERAAVKELLPLIRAFNAALDRLSDAFARRRRFIADVAHELRTPLAVLGMHVDAMPPGRTKTDLQRTVFRLGQMVGQMLDSERLALVGRRRVPFDLVAVARDVSAEVAPLAIANGYEMAFSTECGALPIEGDAHAIARAISNLLGNAVAHGGGSGTIEVRVTADATVQVSDEGPGIAAEARERIFEPFHRERWDRDGCGLGLYLVREIMQAQGGEATVCGEGRGATFVLRFRSPMSPTTNEANLEAGNTLAGAPRLRRLTALLGKGRRRERSGAVAAKRQAIAASSEHDGPLRSA